jgi:hypothetical protein
LAGWTCKAYRKAKTAKQTSRPGGWSNVQRTPSCRRGSERLYTSSRIVIPYTPGYRLHPPAPKGGRCRIRVYPPKEDRDASVVLCSELPNSPGRSATKGYCDAPLRTADVSAVDSDISRRVKSRDFCNFFQGFHPLLRLHAHHPRRLTVSGPPMVEQLLRVQVSPARQPLLRLLDRQRAYQPQARLPVREDPHHPRPALYLLVETFKAVGGVGAWAMAFREGWHS